MYKVIKDIESAVHAYNDATKDISDCGYVELLNINLTKPQAYVEIAWITPCFKLKITADEDPMLTLDNATINERDIRMPYGLITYLQELLSNYQLEQNNKHK